VKQKIISFLRVLTLVSLTGCGSLQERASRLTTGRSSERREAALALETLIRTRLEAGLEISPDLMDRLRLMAERAQYPNGDPDPQVRATCLSALGRLSVWKDWLVFRNALQDPALRCKWEALHALRTKRVREAASAVLPFLDRENPFLLRFEAVRYVHELRITEAIPRLVGIVTDLVERDQLAIPAWLALRDLTGQDFGCDDFIAWRKWYDNYLKSGSGSPQVKPSGEGSPPAEGKGSGGGAPSENR